MRLPSGVGITQTDLVYLKNLLNPPKAKRNGTIDGCWYCGNGHDRQYIDHGLLSYELCECGSSISSLPKHKTVKTTANQRLAKELTAKFAPHSAANIRKMKRLV